MPGADEALAMLRELVAAGETVPQVRLLFNGPQYPRLAAALAKAKAFLGEGEFRWW